MSQSEARSWSVVPVDDRALKIRSYEDGDDIDSVIVVCDSQGVVGREKFDLVDERADDAIIVIHKLREAVAFLRSCELSGERGAADHPVVLRALDLGKRWTAGELGLMDRTDAEYDESDGHA